MNFMLARKFILTFLAICFGYFSSIGLPFSAEISLVTHDECNARLSGEIVKGDLDRFRKVLSNGFETENEYGVESAISSRVCLSSLGGNLNEAAKIGQFFYKSGIGTFVDKGDKCLSACAFIFMMGVAHGGEEALIDRAMHREGIIGFHRPAIRVPEQEEYSAIELQQVFDVGIDSIIGLIKLSQNAAPNGRTTMMKPDLLEQALARHGDDYYYIDTVDKVGRWDIEVVDIPKFKTLDKNSAWNVCHNLIAWKSSLNTSHEKFTSDEEDSGFVAEKLEIIVGYFDNRTAVPAYRIVPKKIKHIRMAGDSFDANCYVFVNSDDLRICAHSNQNGAQFGSNQCIVSEQVNEYSTSVGKRFAKYLPDTKLTDLYKFQNSGARETRASKPINGLCQIYKGNKFLESEHCKKVGTFDVADGIESYYFVWPSGSKTIVSKTSAGITKINGSLAKLSNRFKTSKCYTSQKTGNTFCFTPIT